MSAPKACAVITGACGGIGQALVHAFDEAGYSVIGSDRTDPPAGLPCGQFVRADLQRTVEDESYAQQIFAEIGEMLRGAPLKALVNNAAEQILGGVDALTRQDWQASLAVNLLAPFFWSQAFLHRLEDARGRIVNISSIHAHLTKKNFVAYATSKAALSGLTRSMAVDLGRRVRVNAIEPAAIATGMLKASFSDTPELYAQLEAAHPVGRIGHSEEVARLAAWLVSDDAAFVDGACIGLDGGIRARLHDPA